MFGINLMLDFVPMEPLPPTSSVWAAGLQQYNSVPVFWQCYNINISWIFLGIVDISMDMS